MELVTVEGLDTISGKLHYIVKSKDGTLFQTTDDRLQYQEVPDIAAVPQKPKQYLQQSKLLTEEEYKAISNVTSLDPLQHEYLSWHNRLNHLPLRAMKILIMLGILPRKLSHLYEENSFHLCASCLFGQAHHKPWRSKGKQSQKKIRHDSDDKPGKGTLIDQLVSNQPDLVPQVSGKLTSQRIMGAAIFVDHFSDLVYIYLMMSLSGEETLAAKCAYKRVAQSHGVTIRRYRTDNG
eukprot:14598621-Ditylum_brightwellii.AAC.2